MVKNVLRRISPQTDNWEANLYWAASVVNNTPMIYGHSPREIAFGTPSEKIPISLADVLQNMQESAPLCDRLAHCDNVDIVLMQHRLADHARRHTFEDTCLKNVRKSEKH